MIKKIFISIGVLFSFFLMFLFGFDKINILAMGNFDNSIGTVPIRMDIDNYNNKNLFDNNGDSNLMSRGFEDGQVYTLRIFNSTEPYFYKISTYSSASGTNELITGNFSEGTYFTFTFTYVEGKQWNLYLWNSGWNRLELQNYDIMIVKGDVLPNEFEPYYEFKFGYYANLTYIISAYSSTSVNYYFNNMTFNKTTSSVDSGYLLENYYIPFYVDDNGYISLNDINFGISSIDNSDNSNTYSLQLELLPVFIAYYNGELTTNIYTKLNYMSNDLFFSGITFSGCNEDNCSSTINSVNLSLTNPKTLVLTELNDTGSITTTNISTYYNDEIKNRDYFEYNNYLNVSFKIGDLADNYTIMNGINYSFGISSLSSRIVDNQTTTTPLPNNPNTIDKYNTCSAWYDIPCQLGNAITFVIYEAPIISPVLTFIVSFITMFSSLVSFVELFKSFGIIFGCFIVYMFIELLHKYSK